MVARARSQRARFAGTNPINTSHHGPSPRYPMRLLFSSIHCYLDPSSGAALCTRELLELLAARGMDCRVLTTGILSGVGAKTSSSQSLVPKAASRGNSTSVARTMNRPFHAFHR